MLKPEHTYFDRALSVVMGSLSDLQRDNDEAEQRAMLRAAQAELPRIQALRDPIPNRPSAR